MIAPPGTLSNRSLAVSDKVAGNRFAEPSAGHATPRVVTPAKIRRLKTYRDGPAVRLRAAKASLESLVVSHWQRRTYASGPNTSRGTHSAQHLPTNMVSSILLNRARSLQQSTGPASPTRRKAAACLGVGTRMNVERPSSFAGTFRHVGSKRVSGQGRRNKQLSGSHAASPSIGAVRVTPHHRSEFNNCVRLPLRRPSFLSA